MQKIEYIELTKLTPHPENPRDIDDAQFAVLCQSLKDNKDYFETRPILCNPQMVIFAGNMRYKAAQKVGMSEVPVAIMDIPESRQRELMIRDNRANGSWDFDMLANLFEPDDLIKWGFTEEELDFDNIKPTAKDDDLPDGASVVPVSVLGDVYEFELENTKLRIMCGDTANIENVKTLVGEESMDLVVTDPPYNVAYEGNPTTKRDAIKNDSKTRQEFLQFLRDVFTSINVASKEGAGLYAFMSDQEFGTLMTATEEAGFHWSSTIVWNKDSIVMGRKDYHSKHELAWYGWKNGPRLNPVEDRTEGDVWDIDRPKASELHPCLTPETIIVAGSGYKPISEVKIGEKVYCEDGRFHQVLDVSSHGYSEDIFDIKVRGTNIIASATHNHPFLVLSKDRNSKNYVEADSLKIGDYILTPILNQPISDVDITEEDAFLVGLFLAEGSFLRAGHGSNQYQTYTLHKKETDLIGKIKNKWGDKVSVYPTSSSKNAVSVVVFDPVWAVRMEKLCGKYSTKKTIHESVFGWKCELRKAFIDGYIAGDGATIRNHIAAKTSSRSMAAQLQIISQSVGYKTSVRTYMPSSVGIGERLFKKVNPYYELELRPTKNRKNFDWVEITVGGARFVARMVKTIKRRSYNGSVINLTVDGSPTFMTAIGMSHNTTKPAEFYIRAIKNSSKTSGNVADFFFGSGTAGIACIKTDRNCFGMETDPRYVDVAVRRLADFLTENNIDFMLSRNGESFELPDKPEAALTKHVDTGSNQNN